MPSKMFMPWILKYGSIYATLQGKEIFLEIWFTENLGILGNYPGSFRQNQW